MVGGGRPLLPEMLGQTDLVGAKTPIFSRYSLVAPQPKRVQLTLLESPLYALNNEPKMNTVSFVLSPTRGGGAQNAKGRFPISNCTLLEESLLQSFFICENCLRQSRRPNAFIGLSLRAKMIGGGRPFYVKIRRILTHPLAKRRFSVYFLS